MSYQEYERLTRERALGAFERFSQALGHEIGKRGLTEEQLLKDLSESRREVFKEQYGDLAK